MKNNIDDTDIEILGLLVRDSKITTQGIADKVHVSTASAWRRIKAMEDSGVIKGYHAVVDQEALGYTLTAFAHVTLNRHTTEGVAEFDEAIAAMPQVLESHSITGQADYILKIRLKNIRDYEMFLNDVLFKLPGVGHVHSSIALRSLS